MIKVKEFNFGSVYSFIFLIALFFISRQNYLLFHSFAELYSIVIAAAIYVVAINTKKYLKNKYIYFIGISYLFIGLLDLLHTLSYKGMGVFSDYDYYANQLWIATRYLESLTLLVAIIFIKRPGLFKRKDHNHNLCGDNDNYYLFYI
ncbi:MAG: MASE3 domain-containing protein [Syntrophotaleaceae bacterium]